MDITLPDGVTADLSFELEESLTRNSEISPAVYYWNEEIQFLEKVETNNHSRSSSTLIVHNGVEGSYIVLDETKYSAAWSFKILAPDTENTKSDNIQIVFALDESGSMGWNDRSDIRHQATRDFIDELSAEDEASIVSFSGNGTLIQEFTTDKDLLKSAVGRTSPLRTSIYLGFEVALDQFSEISSGEEVSQRYVFLLTDGEGSYTNKDKFIKEAKDKNVVIYTVGLGDDPDSQTLAEISNATGGKYVHSNNADELFAVFSQISGEITDYNKDSDEDMINDYYEKKLNSGELRLGDGTTLIGMDYLTSDKDGDNLLDGEELLIAKTNSYGYGNGDYLTFTYVKMNSNPLKEDSDGDDVDDAFDPYKLVPHSFKNLSKYMTNDDWGAVEFDQAIHENIGNPNEHYTTIVVHHTVRNQYEDIKKLEENEINDGFNGIPYHFVIDGDGIIYQGVPIEYKGSHVGGNNSYKVGVALMGNFESTADGWKEWLKNALPTDPTDKQIEALKELTYVLDTQYGIEDVGGHKDYTVNGNTTLCPGDMFYDNYDEEWDDWVNQ